jgi:hypothetical protein
MITFTFGMLKRRAQYLKEELGDKVTLEEDPFDDLFNQVTITGIDEVAILTIFSSGVRYGINMMTNEIKTNPV